MPRWKKRSSWAAALLALVTAAPALADGPRLMRDKPAGPGEPAASAADPLDRLHKRSPADRWRQIRELLQPRWAPRPKPAATSGRPERAIPLFSRQDHGPAPARIGLPVAFQRDDAFPFQEGGAPEPVADPRKLRPITEILPFPDYSPVTPTEPDEAPIARVPEEHWTTEPFVARVFPPSVYTWEASNLWHNPLYFEDPQLERYGHTHSHLLQPFVSVGRFSGQLVGLPYQMTIHPAWERQYVLGWYRPGEPAPKLHYQVPWNTRAALVQAGVMTGLFFAIP